MDFAKIRESFSKVENKSKPKLQLVKNNNIDNKTIKTESIYDMFERLAFNIDDVELEEKKYPAGDLVALLRCYPVSLIWIKGEGWTIHPKPEFEDYNEFRNEYLVPNTSQIKQLIQLANNEIEKQIRELQEGA
ncbi:hypothetical protein [Orenia marismortui]|uniref:Uncharacterized protein n=1 Tax=Orenia marismortui TaxID=46469 RepID=A0A4V3GWM3_9FIRM|nr:hypothetical protein [Orenia marismortui]TDX44589.1 hypothetical protein C7959_15013 [Orenia marismortui]